MHVRSSSGFTATAPLGTMTSRTDGGVNGTDGFSSVLKKLRNPPPPPRTANLPSDNDRAGGDEVGSKAKSQSSTNGGAGGPVTFTADGLAKAFAKYDTDGDGNLSRKEFIGLNDVLASGRSTLTEAATGRVVDGSYMFDVIDRVKVGSISLNQLVADRYGLDHASPAGRSPSLPDDD